MRITKKAISDNDKQILELLRECQSRELIRNKRSHADGKTVPLTSWLRSATNQQIMRNGGSRILTLLSDERVRLRFHILWHNAFEVVEWIAKRQALTSWQIDKVADYVFLRHAGRCESFYDGNITNYSFDCLATNDELNEMMRRYAKDRPPLNFLIHPRLADLILIKILYKTLTKDY